MRGLTDRLAQMDAATGLVKESLERATYLHAMEPEGLSTIEQQAMETLYKAADTLERWKSVLQHIANMQDGEQAWWARDIAHVALNPQGERP